jgi:hypothetical protein
VDEFKSHVTNPEKKFEALEAGLVIQMEENKQLKIEVAAKVKILRTSSPLQLSEGKSQRAGAIYV